MTYYIVVSPVHVKDIVDQGVMVPRILLVAPGVFITMAVSLQEVKLLANLDYQFKKRYNTKQCTFINLKCLCRKKNLKVILII